MTDSLGLIRVVIVDNDESELYDLVRGMYAAHLPVLPLLYSVDSGVIDVPDPARLSIRLLFVDMNLADASTPPAKDLVPNIAEVITAVVSQDNGPYALIFWSKHAHLVDEVVRLLGERHADIPMPVVTTSMDKNQFRKPASNDPATRTAWITALRTEIRRVITQSPQLTALMEWENEIGKAAAKTLSALFGVLEKQSSWNITSHVAELGKLLAKISEEAVGKKHAAAKPEEAIYSGLQPLLVDSLERNASASANRPLWLSAMPSLNDKIQGLPSLNVHRRLNTYYCISTVVAHVEKCDRGAFVKIPSASVEDDIFLATFGKNVNDLADEFINVAGLNKVEKSDARRSVTWGLIEVSADCDHAQKKARLFRYLLAAIVSNVPPSRTKFEDSNGDISDRKHNAIYRMPELEIEIGKPVVIFVNYRYLLGLPLTSPLLGDVDFRLRSSVLNELIHNYSRYVSRPGIISFPSV